jgi:periplasmic mercuric ion binding protein
MLKKTHPKTYPSVTWLCFLLALLVTSPSVAEPMSIKAEVNGMVCAFCAQGIDARLRKNKASKDVYVNLKNRIVAVELKEGQAYSLEAFTADIAESGYTVTKAELVSEPLSSIRAIYKK